MAISPTTHSQLCTRFGRLALAPILALTLSCLTLPSFALTGDESAPAVSPAPKHVAPDFVHQDYMLNWGDARQHWAEQGFTFNAFYITDALGDYDAPKGDIEAFSNWQRIRATVDYDFGKVTRAKGLNFHATGVWQNGVNIGSYIGSLANPSGIVSYHQFRLDSMWLQQKLLHDKVTITAGLMASQDFYGIQEYGGSFLSEPLDYAFGNMGNVRASYDPESGPGAEIKFQPIKQLYVKTGWFLPSDDSQVAGHEYRPTFANYRNGSYGSTWDIEAGYFTDANAPTMRKSYPGIIKVGFIYNGSQAGSGNSIMGTSGFFDYGREGWVDGNWDMYFQANQPVYRVKPGSNRGLDVTLGGNFSNPSKGSQAQIGGALVSAELTGGAIFNAPFACRPKDSLAFGFVFSKVSDDFNKFQSKYFGTAARNNETQLELNYKLQLLPWFLLQPVWQHYVNVGGSNDSASVAGFRTQVTF